MTLIDTHAHLDFDYFKNDFSQFLNKASEADVRYIINIAIDRNSIINTLKLIEEYPFIYGVLGIHPHKADNVSGEDIEMVRKHLDNPKVVAVGEVGLDFHRNYAGQENQRTLFRQMIHLAREFNKPIVIHNRDADEETMNILTEEGAQELSGVFHCFAGDSSFGERVINFGFYVSFTGNLTYPNSKLPQTAAALPIERMLIETDCPFLPPQPVRKYKCEPAHLTYTAQKLTEIKGLTLEDIARITTFNAHRLFGVGDSPQSTIAYPIRNSLYVNLTNRCSCECVFCPRLKNPVVKGHNLKLEKEPDFQEVINAINQVDGEYKELVFCGYGEPTERFELLKQVAKRVRGRFKKIRLNTNGQGNLINKRDITPELAGVVDMVSVSLNAADAATYDKINRSQFGIAAFPSVLDFIHSARNQGLKVTVSIVGYPGADVEGAAKLANELGVEFRIRKYNDLG